MFFIHHHHISVYDFKTISLETVTFVTLIKKKFLQLSQTWYQSKSEFTLMITSVEMTVKKLVIHQRRIRTQFSC